MKSSSLKSLSVTIAVFPEKAKSIKEFYAENIRISEYYKNEISESKKKSETKQLIFGSLILLIAFGSLIALLLMF